MEAVGNRKMMALLSDIYNWLTLLSGLLESFVPKLMKLSAPPNSSTFTKTKLYWPCRALFQHGSHPNRCGLRFENDARLMREWIRY
jgi:hypothetical protein